MAKSGKLFAIHSWDKKVILFELRNEGNIYV